MKRISVQLLAALAIVLAVFTANTVTPVFAVSEVWMTPIEIDWFHGGPGGPTVYANDGSGWGLANTCSATIDNTGNNDWRVLETCTGTPNAWVPSHNPPAAGDVQSYVRAFLLCNGVEYYVNHLVHIRDQVIVHCTGTVGFHAQILWKKFVA